MSDAATTDLAAAVEAWATGNAAHWSLALPEGSDPETLLGRLWHASDAVPLATQQGAAKLLVCRETEIDTWARLVRRLRRNLDAHWRSVKSEAGVF